MLHFKTSAILNLHIHDLCQLIALLFPPFRTHHRKLLLQTRSGVSVNVVVSYRKSSAQHVPRKSSDPTNHLLILMNIGLIFIFIVP